jgi:hypothetical protein
MIWHFSYQMPYQPSTHISPRVFGPCANMGVSGWYDMWYEKWHIIMYIASGGSDLNEESNSKIYYVIIWLYVLVNQNSTFPFIVENILSFNCKYCSEYQNYLGLFVRRNVIPVFKNNSLVNNMNSQSRDNITPI